MTIPWTPNVETEPNEQNGEDISLLRRRYDAWLLNSGVEQVGFLPAKMFANGKRWAISAPADNGTKIAFLDIFLDCCYGIVSIGHSVRTVLDIGAHAGLWSGPTCDLLSL